MRKLLLIFVLLAFCILILPNLHMRGSLRGQALSVSASTNALQRTSAYAVTGKPTISRAKIDQLLCATYQGLRSTACGTGNALYALGVTYGIDPIYATAFFQHESAFGTQGVAVITLSLGNIRCSAGYRCYDGYRAYASWEQGYEDWYRLLLYGYIRGQIASRCPCITVEQIIPVYAPQADQNDEDAYISAVETAVDT